MKILIKKLMLFTSIVTLTLFISCKGEKQIEAKPEGSEKERTKERGEGFGEAEDRH